MAISSLVLILAALVLVVALSEPIARRLKLPASVVLAIVGVLVGGLAGLSLHADMGELLAPMARFFVDPSIDSELFIYVFLPTLLFHSALGMDIGQLADDVVPVLVLAVVAVFAATLAIGAALWPIAGLPLAACLLLGCIVATTDPVAVIGVFKDVGAPERLVRLVEGEALLNDAAAIVLFVIFTGLIGAGTVDAADMALDFLTMPLGGALIGIVVGRLFTFMIARLGDNRLIDVSLSLALPYLVYPLAEMIHVSGVIAVVSAGLTLAAVGPARLTPDDWRYLKDIWNQLAFLAGSLVFLFASILVPRLLHGVGWSDALLVIVVAGAAIAARWIILFVVLPLLAATRLSPSVSRPHRLVILWGGLRGATTLALALAITENEMIPPEVKRFVAATACGFTVFTLLVQGTTLRPLMRVLGLDRLTPIDEVLRDQAIAVAYEHAAERITEAAARYHLAPSAAGVAAGYGERARQAREAAESATALTREERVAIALVALAGQEREVLLRHAGKGLVTPRLVERLLADSRALLDGARLRGEAGYLAAADTALAFNWQDSLADRLHRRFGVTGGLARRLEHRFERLLLVRVALESLGPFLAEDVVPLFGADVGRALKEVLKHRREWVSRGLDALRLQYPDHAEALERRFLARLGLAVEAREIAALGEKGLINAEVTRELEAAVADGRRRQRTRLPLDLGLDTRELVSRTPLFADFSAAQQAEIAAALQPVLAFPGRRLIRRGERGDAAFFISSGAVEVDTGRATFRLGRGDVFGEMALVTGAPRSGDVTALGYCSLLRLAKRDFDRLLQRYPDLRAHVEALAAERTRVNRPAPAPER